LHVSSRSSRLAGVVLTLLAIACSDRPEPGRAGVNPARYSEIRGAIRSHLHFNLHCWCMAADPDTISSVRARVTQLDIPVLIELLADADRQVEFGARGVLVRFGPEAVPALKAAAGSRGPSSYEAAQALVFINEPPGQLQGPAQQ
jgi:hypothetical protein